MFTRPTRSLSRPAAPAPQTRVIAKKVLPVPRGLLRSLTRPNAPPPQPRSPAASKRARLLRMEVEAFTAKARRGARAAARAAAAAVEMVDENAVVLWAPPVEQTPARRVTFSPEVTSTELVPRRVPERSATWSPGS